MRRAGRSSLWPPRREPWASACASSVCRPWVRLRSASVFPAVESSPRRPSGGPRVGGGDPSWVRSLSGSPPGKAPCERRAVLTAFGPCPAHPFCVPSTRCAGCSSLRRRGCCWSASGACFPRRATTRRALRRARRSTRWPRGPRASLRASSVAGRECTSGPPRCAPRSHVPPRLLRQPPQGRRVPSWDRFLKRPPYSREGAGAARSTAAARASRSGRAPALAQSASQRPPRGSLGRRRGANFGP